MGPRSTTAGTSSLETEGLYIPGRCRGVLFSHWVQNLRLHLGEASVKKVQDDLLGQGFVLPENPRPLDWYPAWAQLRFADVVVHELLGGDVMAFETVLEQTAKHEAKGLFVLRRLGLKRLCRHATKVHSFLYDVGDCEVVHSKKEVRLSYTGAPLVFHPTWQLLHHSALRVFSRVLGGDLYVERGLDPGKAFHLTIREP